ncbi:MAG: hypothetical protein ACREVY_12935 [Gammaproteobacteria bacterium]
MNGNGPCRIKSINRLLFRCGPESLKTRELNLVTIRPDHRADAFGGAAVFYAGIDGRRDIVAG